MTPTCPPLPSGLLPAASFPTGSRTSILRCLAAIWICAVSYSAATADEIKAEVARVRSGHAAKLEELALWCDEHGLEDQARQTRDWPLPDDPHRFYPVMLDVGEAATVAGEAVGKDVAAWRARFDSLRREQAAALFALAASAAADDDCWSTYRLVWATVRENPDHEGARRALGFRQVDGRWLTRFEADKHRAKQVWHDRFGWLPAAHVARYESGERYYGGSWMSEEQEGRIRADISRGWSVPTEHFVVKTNHTLESGVRLAARLELLYDVWRQMFVGYYATPRDIKQMIRGRPPRRHSPRRHQVIYYRDRDEYDNELRALQPNIDITTGIYMGDKRTSYFFAAEDEDHGTQYHEITHQLFSESRPVVQDIGRRANFWIVEGVACYMESLHRRQGRYAVGGLETQRMVAARYRLTEDGFYVPLAQFNALGREALQRDPRIRTLYSQATGWTHFLIHYQDGRYRHALTDYLVAVYTGRDRVDTLAELTSTSLEQLDRQYRDFMAELD